MPFSCRKFIISLVGLSLLTLMAACSGDRDVVNNGTGRLTLDVEVDNTLRYPDGSAAAGVDVPRPALGEVGVAMQSIAGDYSRVWDSYRDFPAEEIYFVGTYYIDAFYGYGEEGFATPSYATRIESNVLPGELTTADLTLGIYSSANRLAFAPGFTEYFSSVKAVLHADKGGYFDITPSENRILYLQPGRTSLYLELVLSDGRKTSFRLAQIESAKSACLYDYLLSVAETDGVPVVTCTVEEKNYSVALDDALISALPPVITPSGWDPDAVMSLPEGEIPSAPVMAEVSSSSPLSSLWLTVTSLYLNSVGFPGQCDLLNLTPEQDEAVRSLGLSWTVNGNRARVYFTNLLGKLVYINESGAVSSVGLMAEDSRGRVSEPVMLRVESTPVDLSISSVAPAMIGARNAEIAVMTPATDFADNVAIEIMNDKGVWEAANITKVYKSDDGLHHIVFDIPQLSRDLSARILYCREVRADFVINRFMPEFTLETDPFATYCCVKVHAGSEEIRSIVVQRLDIYLDGHRASVLARDLSSGVIVVTNLTPKTTYALTSTMMTEPDKDDFTPELKFSTESTPGLPNSEFEERRDGIYYPDMPSGGRYSQTTVAIFNWQNHHSFNFREPKEWANTNSKTFNRRSANHNTWYMQPSVYTVKGEDNESFAVCLRSVAFDTNGAPIPDYTQTGQPYLKYSPIIPEIAYRAAGRLFLGGYSFNPETLAEEYRDIVDWKSRPMSLNGYYKYTPSPNDPSDMGLAIIEVYGMIDGKQSVIGSSTTYLPAANSYSAFKASVSYKYFGVKATGLKVMFTSSSSIGTVEEESRRIITNSDPVEAASVGSTLWLDHVNLAY